MAAPIIPADLLLLVDVQNGLLQGTEAVPHAEAVRANIEYLISKARRAGAPILFLQNDGPPGSLDEPGAEGWQLSFTPEGHDVVIRKDEDDGFTGTPLSDVLESRNIRQLAIAGMVSEMCLAATARSALQRGYGVILPHDGHTTYDVPAGPGGSPAVPAELAARAAEWSLGDQVDVVGSVHDVEFAPITR